jgi:succinyl-CoA synthetase alpha subunit
MSNELNNIVSRNANGVYEGVAIGGDRCVLTVHSDCGCSPQIEPNIML